MIDFDLDNLLENRFDITPDEYWLLPDEQKDEITEMLFDIVILLLLNNKLNHNLYLELLSASIEFEIFNENYETVEILTRLKNKIKKTFYI